MKWYIYVTTDYGRFLYNYYGIKTKREAVRIAEEFKKYPENKKVEVVKE